MHVKFGKIRVLSLIPLKMLSLVIEAHSLNIIKNLKKIVFYNSIGEMTEIVKLIK